MWQKSQTHRCCLDGNASILVISKHITSLRGMIVAHLLATVQMHSSTDVDSERHIWQKCNVQFPRRKSVTKSGSGKLVILVFRRIIQTWWSLKPDWWGIWLCSPSKPSSRDRPEEMVRLCEHYWLPIIWAKHSWSHINMGSVLFPVCLPAYVGFVHMTRSVPGTCFSFTSIYGLKWTICAPFIINFSDTVFHCLQSLEIRD